MIVYAFIYHLHYDMFRPVIETIIGQCCKYVKGKKWNSGLSFTIKIEAYNNVIIMSDNGLIKCISRQYLRYCSVLVSWSMRSGNTLNLLKPTGHVTHQQFNIQQLYALPTLYLCVLYLSENKQRLVPLTA
jgi:hypothetical protein